MKFRNYALIIGTIFLIILVVIYLKLLRMEHDFSDMPEFLKIYEDQLNHELCIVVPFRNRFDELLNFAPYMDQFLHRQGVKYKLLILNQADNYRFNRASLINIGFKEAEILGCDYLAMHDVDLLPLNTNLTYKFPSRTGVFHLASPEYHPLYNYSTFIGGILLITLDNYRLVNGMSNKYWGWGLEDDEFYLRLKDANLVVDRPRFLSSNRTNTFRNLHNSAKYKRDMRRFGNQRKETRRRDKRTGLGDLKYRIDQRWNIQIENVSFTVVVSHYSCMILTEFIESGGVAVMYPDDILFSITLPQLTLLCCCLPAGAFVVCVLLALMLHFEGSTKTHCNVPNYLPSISAAIGDYTPERYVWRFCIALHCLPRFMAALAYRNFYQNCPLIKTSHSKSKTSADWRGFYNILCHLISIFHVIENLLLLALTIVSSTENHEFHEVAFVAFIVFSQIYMITTLIVFNLSGRRRSSTNGRKSYQCKFLFYIFNTTALLISAYFFVRHNTYCESGVYTIFAVCEYIVVLTNIAFHSTAALDFNDKVLVMTSESNLGFKHH